MSRCEKCNHEKMTPGDAVAATLVALATIVIVGLMLFLQGEDFGQNNALVQEFQKVKEHLCADPKLLPDKSEK